MPRPIAADCHADELADALADGGFYLPPARRPMVVLTIEPGDMPNVFARACLRRDAQRLWSVEMPKSHPATPLGAELDEGEPLANRAASGARG